MESKTSSGSPHFYSIGWEKEALVRQGFAQGDQPAGRPWPSLKKPRIPRQGLGSEPSRAVLILCPWAWGSSGPQPLCCQSESSFGAGNQTEARKAEMLWKGREEAHHTSRQKGQWLLSTRSSPPHPVSNWDPRQSQGRNSEGVIPGPIVRSQWAAI